MFKKKDYRVRKYKPQVKLNFEIYEPKQRIDLRGETVPLFFKVCNVFLFLGGMISFFASGLVMVIKGFFGVKNRIQSTSNARIVKYNNLNKKRIRNTG